LVEIKLENIHHVYPGGVEAIRGVSITFENNVFSGLLGPSGCGKTTLMKIIAGIIKPTDGRVFFDGDDVTDLSPQQRNIAMVFQFPVVYDMSVYKNIAFPLMVRKVPQNEIKNRVMEVAELLDLKQHLNIHAGKLDLSGKQRVAIGRALVRTPNAFILDEPFSNLDPHSRVILRAKLKEIQKELKQTMIFVTHDQSEALTLSDKIAIMKDGLIVQYDTPENIYENPADVFVAFFVGMPAMNLIECSLENNYLKFGSFSYEVSEIVDILNRYGTEFILGIRAEHVEITGTHEGEFKLRCVMVENLGVMSLLHLEESGVNIKVKTIRKDIAEGDVVSIRFPKNKIKIFAKDGKRII